MGIKSRHSGSRGAARFERISSVPYSGKRYRRSDIDRRLSREDATHPGVLLALLWPLFGPPDPQDAGFEYSLRDTETGLTFEAYSGSAGPHYRGPESDQLIAVLTAFESLLATTEPADCEILYPEESEYGGGMQRLGFRDGMAYIGQPIGLPHPATATSYEDCLELMTAYGEGDSYRGWSRCLSHVLPMPPREIEVNGAVFYTHTYIDYWPFVDDDCVAIVHLYENPQKLDPVAKMAVEHVPFDPPLSANAQLWVRSLARWRADRRST